MLVERNYATALVLVGFLVGDYFLFQYTLFQYGGQ